MTQEDRVHRVRVLRRALNTWLRDPGKFLGWLKVVSASIDKIAGARATGDDAWVTTQTQAAQTALTDDAAIAAGNNFAPSLLSTVCRHGC